MSVLIRSPLRTLHTLTVISEDPETKYSPSKENTTLHTIWPVKILTHSPFDILHTRIVLSKDPEAKYSPSKENTTLFTSF